MVLTPDDQRRFNELSEVAAVEADKIIDRHWPGLAPDDRDVFMAYELEETYHAVMAALMGRNVAEQMVELDMILPERLAEVANTLCEAIEDAGCEWRRMTDERRAFVNRWADLCSYHRPQEVANAIRLHRDELVRSVVDPAYDLLLKRAIEGR